MIVETRELVKIYPMGKLEVQALRGITLGIESGAFISVMGPSGSGKSTLLNILGCMDRPSTGVVMLDGVDLGKAKARHLPRIRREKVGFVFQQYQLLSHLTALENVMLPLRYADVGGREARKRATGVLEQVGLGIARTIALLKCPAASNSGSPLLGRSSTVRPLCWPMSRPATLTPNPVMRFWLCCALSMEPGKLSLLLPTILMSLIVPIVLSICATVWWSPK